MLATKFVQILKLKKAQSLLFTFLFRLINKHYFYILKQSDICFRDCFFSNSNKYFVPQVFRSTNFSPASCTFTCSTTIDFRETIQSEKFICRFARFCYILVENYWSNLFLVQFFTLFEALSFLVPFENCLCTM